MFGVRPKRRDSWHLVHACMHMRRTQRACAQACLAFLAFAARRLVRLVQRDLHDVHHNSMRTWGQHWVFIGVHRWHGLVGWWAGTVPSTIRCTAAQPLPVVTDACQ